MTAEDGISLLLGLAPACGASAEITPSTMMGFPCLRVRGKFFASVNREANALIVKLPAARVAALVESGEGRAFAPNGRVFREWLSLPAEASGRWGKYLREAYLFVGASAS